MNQSQGIMNQLITQAQQKCAEMQVDWERKSNETSNKFTLSMVAAKVNFEELDANVRKSQGCMGGTKLRTTDFLPETMMMMPKLFDRDVTARRKCKDEGTTYFDGGTECMKSTMDPTSTWTSLVTDEVMNERCALWPSTCNVRWKI